MWFHGGRGEGWRAVSVLMSVDIGALDLYAVRRTWPVLDGEPTGPYWEVAFLREKRGRGG